jgi:hypothetical protein
MTPPGFSRRARRLPEPATIPRINRARNHSGGHPAFRGPALGTWLNSTLLRVMHCSAQSREVGRSPGHSISGRPGLPAERAFRKLRPRDALCSVTGLTRLPSLRLPHPPKVCSLFPARLLATSGRKYCTRQLPSSQAEVAGKGQ